jgi:rhodanese-related sulfurtransferase
MNFWRNLAGGFLIILVASVVGVAQNAVRGNPIKLIPRMASANMPSGQNEGAGSETASTPADPATGEPQDQDAEAHDAGAVSNPGEVEGAGLDKEAVKSLMEAGTAYIIDARDAAEYEEGHIPGAINIPYSKLADYYARLTDLVPLDGAVVCYCRSIDCDLSDSLAKELRLMGYANVKLYRGGWMEWSAAGFPAETGKKKQ